MAVSTGRHRRLRHEADPGLDRPTLAAAARLLDQQAASLRRQLEAVAGQYDLGEVTDGAPHHVRVTARELVAWLERQARPVPVQKSPNTPKKRDCSKESGFSSPAGSGKAAVLGESVETDDVLQNALVRLLRALREVRPESMRHFFALAAEQMRRELLDLARHYYGPHGHGAHHASHGPQDDTEGAGPEPADRGDDSDELERWCQFHREVERLPAEEREVVGLVFYHGWTQADVAELFGVSERTVRRRWEAALGKLHAVLKDSAPKS
jgi:RNA polymerase sigma factor (sigma-70 family)